MSDGEQGEGDAIGVSRRGAEGCGPGLARPPSASIFPINLCGLAAFVATILWFRGHPAADNVLADILCLLAYSLPAVALEARLVHPWRRPSAGLTFDRSPDYDLDRVATKLIGLAATLRHRRAAVTPRFPSTRETSTPRSGIFSNGADG